MTILTDASPASIAFADLMSLTSPPVSRKVYNDAKLLIEELNKHAEPESYAVVTARFKKFKMLEFEVIWGHIDILVVVVRRLPRRWKVKTLLAGPSPTSPMRRRLPTSLFPTLPFGNRSLQTTLFEALKLPFLNLSSSPGWSFQAPPTEAPLVPTRSSTIWSWSDFQRPVHGFQMAILLYTVCFSPEAIHGWLRSFIPFGSPPGAIHGPIWIHRSPRFEGIHPRLNLIHSGWPRFCVVSVSFLAF